MGMKPLVHSKNSVNLSFCSYYELNKQKSSHSPKRLVVRSDSHWKIMRYTQGKPIQAEDTIIISIQYKPVGKTEVTELPRMQVSLRIRLVGQRINVQFCYLLGDPIR